MGDPDNFVVNAIIAQEELELDERKKKKDEEIRFVDDFIANEESGESIGKGGNEKSTKKSARAGEVLSTSFTKTTESTESAVDEESISHQSDRTATQRQDRENEEIHPRQSDEQKKQTDETSTPTKGSSALSCLLVGVCIEANYPSQLYEVLFNNGTVKKMLKEMTEEERLMARDLIEDW